MEECTHDCSSCGASCGSREGAQTIQKEKPAEGTNIKKVIAVVSGKGGVGKSLVTSMLAVLSQRQGKKTAILDADITGPSIPKAFGLKEKAVGCDLGILPVTTKTGIEVMSLNLLLDSETSPVVWRGPVIAGAVTQFWTDVLWNDVDIMFIDMPPGTGDVPLTVFQSLPVDGIIIVTSPQDLVTMIVEKAVNMAKMMKIPVLGIVENLSYLNCPDCGKRIEVFGKSHVEETAKAFDIAQFARLPIDPKFAGGCDEGLIELFDCNALDALVESLLPENDA